MRGWYKESYRHYLASKGIKTNKYFAKRYKKGLMIPATIDWDQRKKKLKVPEIRVWRQEKGGATYRTFDGFDDAMNYIKTHPSVEGVPLIAYDGYELNLFDMKQKKYMASKKGVNVPPAWKNVKFPENKAYVVTGVDAKGRTQYIYPESHSKKKSQQKFKRVKKFEKELPTIIGKVKQDIKKGSQEAEVVYTMYKTGFRPGTEKDTLADKKAFGASNLEKQHVKVKGNKVEFNFTGKKGVEIEKEVRDKLLSDIMRRRINSKKLFNTSESRLRNYFEGKTRGKYNLKDLRTAKASAVAKKTKGDKKEVARAVSDELGNTPAVAIGSYIPPETLRGKA